MSIVYTIGYEATDIDRLVATLKPWRSRGRRASPRSHWRPGWKQRESITFTSKPSVTQSPVEKLRAQDNTTCSVLSTNRTLIPTMLNRLLRS